MLRVFLSDLHLDGSRTPRARTFHALLERLGAQASEQPVELYILGDLFEIWEEYHPQLAERYEADLRALEAAHRAGVKITLLSGNRDFAYGAYVRKRLGAQLFEDGGRIRIGDSRWVWLEHGDLLCSADQRYLRYRRRIRSWPARFFFRLLPWAWAKRFIEKVQARAKRELAAKPEDVLEIDEAAARRRLEETGCRVLLCGHTHRPRSADVGAGLRLLVLPAWCEVRAGYRERQGALVPVCFAEDGTPGPATHAGTPRGGGEA